MSLEVRWLPPAQRDPKRLDPPVQRRVIDADAVERLAQTGEGDVVRLATASPPEYRLRVGRWRVRFARDSEAPLLYVLRVLSRGKAYR